MLEQLLLFSFSPGSKSTEFHEKSKKGKSAVQYGRGISVPDPTMADENDINITYMERKSDGPGHTTVKARQVEIKVIIHTIHPCGVLG